MYIYIYIGICFCISHISRTITCLNDLLWFYHLVIKHRNKKPLFSDDFLSYRPSPIGVSTAIHVGLPKGIYSRSFPYVYAHLYIYIHTYTYSVYIYIYTYSVLECIYIYNVYMYI